MKLFVLLLLTFYAPQLTAKDIIKIEIGKDYNKYTNTELRERIWRLENAVWQLQREVFKLKQSDKGNTVDTWVCTLSAMGDHFSASGPTKAAAKSEVINKCSEKRGDGFFCKEPKCEK